METKPSIFVMVDMEGISGICRTEQVSPDSGAVYQTGRRYMTWDVNACIDGCIRGGAGRVVVRDAHSTGFNFIWEELDPRAEYIQGRSAEQRMPDIGEFQGLILLGYHAMAGTRNAILEHTMSSHAWQNFWLNGVKCGELAIDAAMAGDRGVPTIMASGDDKLCAEARHFIEGIYAAQVKEGLDCNGGRLLPKERAHEAIRDAAVKAVRNHREIKAYKTASPVTMRLELVSRGNVPVRAGVKMIDGRTYEVTADTVEDALKLL
jgi:D-amino peptidase